MHPDDRILDVDEIGATAEITGRHQAFAPEFDDADALGVELADHAVEIPLPPPRSLIPDDILEAIAAEEQKVLSDPGLFSEAVEEHHDSDQVGIEVVSENADATEAFALLKQSAVLCDFPDEALELLVPGAVRHHLGDRQPAFREGAAADSFFCVEVGTLEAVRVAHDAPEVALAHLHEGDPFGLFGLLTRRVRAATVRAIGEAQVVEFRAGRLDAVARSFPPARHALARFFKERLLENFLAVSPLFHSLDALGRAALISHFQDRKVAAGELLLAPGEVQNCICLVTSGRVQVTHREPGKSHELALLTRGNYYGVVSALSGLPTQVTITAQEPSTLCVLPPKAFNEFVRGYPVLRTLPARLHEAGTKVDRDIFVGDATVLG